MIGTQSRSGHTLAELMFSFMLLSLVAVLMVGVMPSSIIGLRHADQRATANMLARDTIERLRKRNFDDLVSGTVGDVNAPDGIVYSVAYMVDTVNPLDPTMSPPQPTAKKLEVTVTWYYRSHSEEQRTCTTLMRSAHS